MKMSLKDLDLGKLSKLITQQIDHVTCLECCKYYIAPATAGCEHTLCHTCWRGRRTCPACATPLERKTLKLNLPLQTLTNHVQVFAEAFEKLFNVKLDEFNLDTPGEHESEKEPDKNVKDWLTSSQNHFSAAIQNSETFSQDVGQPCRNPLEISSSNIIIHTDTKKVTSPPKVVHVPPPQDDWDKIEAMPDPGDNNTKNANIVGPMDIEPFFVDDDEYTTDNPRRSSRKREQKNYDSTVKTHERSSNKHSSRDSSGDNDKKSQKKQTWNNVKRMRKEFSKLNKKNRSKLNVSIEMVKKTQTPKPTINTPFATEQIYNIDDNTPNNNTNKENEEHNIDFNNPVDTNNIINIKPDTALHFVEIKGNTSTNKLVQDSQNIQKSTEIVENSSKLRNNEENSDMTCTEGYRKRDNVPEAIKMPFIKKGPLNPSKSGHPFNNICSEPPGTSEISDDIEISIKVGSTITNIVIKKKQNDVQVKINTDREVQTSSGPLHLDQNKEPSQEKIDKHNVDINIENIRNKDQEPVINISRTIQVTGSNLNKSTGKKNTASADTATAQFEITESVEKELSNIMECEAKQEKEHSSKKQNYVKPTQIEERHRQIEEEEAEKVVEDLENEDDLNDLDIFNSGSVKEANVHVLKEHNTPSEILISTIHSKFRTQNKAEKRNRDNNDEEILPKNKKVKINAEQKSIARDCEHPDSEPINYDAIMGQVFASIDADMEDIRKSQEVENVTILKKTGGSKNNKEIYENIKPSAEIQKTQTIKKVSSPKNTEITPNLKKYFSEKHSENVFSILEKDDEILEISKTDKIPQQDEELLTPILCRNLDSTQESLAGLEKTNKPSKKTQDYDDSDKSVVEETPQKNISISKLKRTSTSNQSQTNLSETNKIPSRKATSYLKSIINLTDTVTESNIDSRNVTVIETAPKKQALETPLTITKFADQIKHKSTPIAKKSLNFDNEKDDNDPEQTLCPTSEVIAKTTQEREFMSKAFEKTPTTPAARSLTARNIALHSNKKFCLAASCLTFTEIAKVKILCNERKWTYVDKYTKDITHLIVGVDEEKKSQRSVKYMCALAASKWIVSFEWIMKCLQSKEVVNEEYFEALDSTGEPGPKRSRIAKKKLFEGITFYCMPPFSVLDVETLKKMLIAAGGRVVDEPKAVRISADTSQPALLLAEPEHTQEDRFIYLAMEQSVVPVNYEWVLNCLGNYTLGSIQELLLCPSSLLPAATARWPEVLIAQDYD